LDVRLSYRGIR